MPRHSPALPLSAALLAWCFGVFQAEAQLRVFDYNTAADSRPGMSTILQAVGAESVNGIAKPPDILTLQEQESAATTTQAIVEVLNALYGAGVYRQSSVDGGTLGGGRPGLIYNTQTVALIAQSAASTASNSGGPRETQRYELRPIGYDDTADFFVYVSHYKSSTGSANLARRNAEAQQVRTDADALGDAHIIYTGDFNVYRSSEPMFQTLLANGAGQAFDPAERLGEWHDNAAFKDVHTQSPVTTAQYGGQVAGGMDDRFDFQLVSAEFLDQEGLSYIGGSYRAFGNTGTHVLNGEITSGSVAALRNRLPGYTQAQAEQVLEALASTSDHLPVVADYQLPARMGVSVPIVPPRIIRDASVSIEVAIANTAVVVAANGADELDYTLSGSGALSGSATGTAAALGPGNTHSLALQTGTVGSATGLVEVHSTSQSAANKDFSQALTCEVLDHARPFFVGFGEATTLTLDFGSVMLGSSSDQQTVSIGNWISDLGSTAGLDLDQIFGSGQTSAFTLSLANFANLASGGRLEFAGSFEAKQVGSFSARYDLLFSDEDLPGSASLRTLHLDLMGNAIPEPNAATLALSGFVLLGFPRSRGSGGKARCR